MDPVFKSAIFHLEPMPGRSARHVVRHPGGVAVLPVHGDDFLLIRNHRRAIGHTLLEVPAGTLELGEDPKHAIQSAAAGDYADAKTAVMILRFASRKG